MAYPKANLHPTERLVLDLHPHWWTFTPSLAALVGSLIVGIVILTGEGWAENAVVRLVWAAVVLVATGWFVTRIIQWATTQLVLTSDRLIWRRGVIAKSGVEIPIDRINTIFFNQRIWERLIGVGDLVVESASATGAQRFDNMLRPSRIQNEIYLQKESRQARAQASTTTHAGDAPSVPDRLATLTALHDSGAITAEEFEAKRAALLEEL